MSAGFLPQEGFSLPGVYGRIDHLDVDLKGKRLFVAALGNNTVEVLDSRTGKQLHTIKDLSGPQGVLFVPELNKLYVTNNNGRLDIFDATSFKLLTSISLASDADNIRYDANQRIIYIGFGDGALARIDAKTDQRLSDITLSGHPESFQIENSGSRIFANVPGAGIAVIDKTKVKVVNTIATLKGNFPMALDETHHRLFVGYRSTNQIAVIDTESGKEVSSVPSIGDVDDIYYDGKQQKLYASGGEGFIMVIKQTDANHYKVSSKITSEKGARTSLFVPEWDRLYVAVPRVGSRSAEIRVYQTQP